MPNHVPAGNNLSQCNHTCLGSMTLALREVSPKVLPSTLAKTSGFKWAEKMSLTSSTLPGVHHHALPNYPALFRPPHSHFRYSHICARHNLLSPAASNVLLGSNLSDKAPIAPAAFMELALLPEELTGPFASIFWVLPGAPLARWNLVKSGSGFKLLIELPELPVKPLTSV
ncbi:hypothetical protein B0H19DRAFT_1373391 [Mycena capillaripes]|nr:hypothetical protein B0H19DRAFT_1373391 [Mycena capillaripes]